jgi:PadR family transcriptional regulator PadR
MLALKTLARLGPMHGYGIALSIRQISEEVLQVVVKDWVAAEWKQSENNRRARYYSLTPKGRRLAAEIGQFAKVTSAIQRVIQRPARSPSKGDARGSCPPK